MSTAANHRKRSRRGSRITRTAFGRKGPKTMTSVGGFGPGAGRRGTGWVRKLFRKVAQHERGAEGTTQGEGLKGGAAE